MFTEFFEENRIKIIIVLAAVIIAGVGVLGFDAFKNYRQNSINNQTAQLKLENEKLRQELSELSKKQIAGAETSTATVSNKININLASSQELDTLPGIGPARAADIINYRKTKGGFRNIEEIKNIKGIGDKSFESLKDLITIGE